MNPKFKIMLPLFLFALVLACSKDTPEPEVSVPPISGLDFAISTNEENPLQVGVTPSATNATSYKIYFDFVGDATTFQTSDGTIVTHTYPEASATYTIKVVASNLDGSDDVELTKQHIVTVVPDTVLIDFESIGPPYFSGSEIEGYIEVVTSGVGDNSTAVGKIVNDGALYTTANIVNMNYIDLTGGVKTITLDFYQESARTPKIMLKLEGNITDDGFDIDKVIEAQASAGWQTIEFDMSTANNSYPFNEEPTVTHSQYKSLVVFIAFEQSDYAGTYYIDNVTTGGSFGDAQLDTDSDGVIDPQDGCIDTAGTAENDGCPAGPSAAATAPSLAASEVLSIYSNAYATNPAVTTYQTDWSANASIENIEISTGENALKATISAANGYAGISFAESFDASAYNTIHFDVWTPGLTSFSFKLEGSVPADAVTVTVPITTTSGWESVSVPISAAITDVSLAVISGATAGQVYIDNIYLYVDDAPPTATVLTISAPDTAASVRITGPWWGWDPNGGPTAVQNDAGTWDVTFPSPGLADNMEFLIIVDGVQENLVDNAIAAECSSRIDGGTLITDYNAYANRKWLLGSGNQSYVYDSCQ